MVEPTTMALIASIAGPMLGSAVGSAKQPPPPPSVLPVVPPAISMFGGSPLRGLGSPDAIPPSVQTLLSLRRFRPDFA